MGRRYPIASCRIYRPGGGHGLITDPGYEWYDVLLERVGNLDPAEAGTYTWDAAGVPQLELLPQVGLTCRPLVIPQDTRLAERPGTGVLGIGFMVAGGRWSEWRPILGGGMDRTIRLAQWDASANVAWAATSTWWLVEDPSFAVSLAVCEPPAAQDAANPSRIQIGFGAGEWAIELHSLYGLRLMRWSRAAAQYVVVLELPAARRQASEMWILVRCVRGRIAISTDLGSTYAVYVDPAGPVRVAPGAVQVRGWGWRAIFGVHQVKYRGGAWESPDRRMYRTRPDALAPSITAWSAWYPRYPEAPHPPMGSTILARVYDPDGRTERDTVRYQASIVPDAYWPENAPWPQYRAPSLHSVLVQYPMAAEAATGESDTPWDGHIEEIRIDHPEELDQSTATIVVRLESAEGMWDESWRFRRVEVYLGWRLDDGTDDLTLVFTGYITEMAVEQEGPGEVVLTVTAEAAAPEKHGQWETTRPYGGMALNDALDAVLGAILPDIATDWHPRGAEITLPPGSAERPAFARDIGDSRWAIIEKMCQHGGMEYGIREDGTRYTVPVGWVSEAVQHTWEAAGTDLEALPLRVRIRYEYGDGASAVVAQGADAAGRPIRAYIDTHAEEQPGSRHIPWRQARVETVSEPCTESHLSRIAVQMYDEAVVRPAIEVAAPVHLGLRRRDRVRITGTGLGEADTADYYVRTLSHTFRADGELSTEATLARVP